MGSDAWYWSNFYQQQNQQYQQYQQSYSGYPGNLGGWGSVTGSANFLTPVADACNGQSSCVTAALDELAKGELQVAGVVIGAEGLLLAKLANGVKNASYVEKATDSLAKTNRVPSIKWGAQEKHFPGHNSYTPGRSTLTSNPTKFAEKAGTGEQVGKLPVGVPGSKERVDFGEKIGTYIDPLGGSSPTTKGLIHYSNDGIHIVPARP